jgi:hypothetical protein
MAKLEKTMVVAQRREEDFLGVTLEEFIEDFQNVHNMNKDKYTSLYVLSECDDRCGFEPVLLLQVIGTRLETDEEEVARAERVNNLEKEESIEYKEFQRLKAKFGE